MAFTNPSSQKYPKPFVSPSLDWLAWLGLAREAPRLWLWMLALELWLLLWLLPTRRATLRQGEPSQARQANQGRDSQMDLDIFVMSPGSGNPLTTGCGSGYIQFVTGPCSRPARGGDPPNRTPGQSSQAQAQPPPNNNTVNWRSQSCGQASCHV